MFCPETGVGFAPDGEMLVFSGFEGENDGTTIPDQNQSTCRDVCPQGLFLARADGTDPHPLPVGVTDAEHPEFMPDGTIIFADKTGANAASRLYMVNVDGSGLRQVTQAGATTPAPCADGRVIYNRGPSLYVLSPNRKRSRWLTRGSLADCAPDSRSLVFLRSRTLYTMTIAGRELRRLSPAGVATGRPTYSPAGRQIAYVEQRTCTTRDCRSQTQGNGCDIVSYRLQVIDLRGRLRRSYRIGSNACTTDGNLGGDAFGQVRAAKPADLALDSALHNLHRPVGTGVPD